MSHRRIGAMTLALGAAAGAVAAAALITSPMAYATDPPPVPAPGPPGIEGTPTDVQVSSVPYLYNFVQENDPYTIFDQADHVVGAYDTKDTSFVVGLLPLVGVINNSAVVTDSTGAAPAVGTEYDGSGVFYELLLGGPGLPLIQNTVMSSPDGTSADWLWSDPLDAGNYFSTGPTGILDELSFFGTVVPIIDIPA